MKSARLLLVTAGFMAVAACGSSTARVNPHPTPSPAPTLSAGWTTLTDPPVAYSIGVPPGWEAARSDDPQRTATLAAIKARHPEAGAYMTKQLTSATNADLAAVVADPLILTSGYISNCSIVRQDVGAVAGAENLAALAQKKLVQLRGAADLKQAPVLKTTSLPQGTAAEIDYSITLQGGREIAARVLLLTADLSGRRFLYELLLAHLAADADAAPLQAVADTFRILRG